MAKHRRTMTVAGLALLVLAARISKAPHPYYSWGFAVMAIGQALRLWASGYLRKDAALTTTGPFAYTRNPIYLGSFLIGVGECVMSGVWIALPVFVTLYWLVYYPTILKEERRLTETFTDYVDYQTDVPRWLPRWPRPAAARNRKMNGAAFSFRQALKNREYEAIVGNAMVALALALER